MNGFGPTRQDQVHRGAQDNFAVSIVVGSLVLAALLTLVILARPFEGRALNALVDVLPIPIYLGSAVLALTAARTSTRSSRLGWSLIALGFVSYVLGDVVWAIYEVAFQIEPPAPSLADPFYLAAIPLLLAGIMFLTSFARTLGQFRTALSGTLVMLGLAALVWEPILQPIFTTSDTSFLGTLVTAAYPLGDAVLVVAIFVAARRQWNGRARVVLYTFAAGLLLATGSDLAFAQMVLNGRYETGSLVDLGWPVGFLLMGLAAGLHARWSVDFAAEIDTRAPSAVSQRARVAMTAGQAVILGGLIARGFAEGLSGDPSLMIILIAMVSVALVRSAVAVADTGMLHLPVATSRTIEGSEISSPNTRRHQ